MEANEKGDKIQKKLPSSADRKKRIQHIKHTILLFIMLLIIIPVICSIYLLFKVNYLEKELYQVKMMKLESNDETKKMVSDPLLGSVVHAAELNNDNLIDDYEIEELNENFMDEEIINAEEVLNKKKVYLTFDDGPSVLTPSVLDILDEYNVKATFFVVGKENELATEIYQRIVNEGHTIGIHSYTHQYEVIYNSMDQYKKDYNRLSNLIYELTGVTPMFYRFPGGSANSISKINIKDCIQYLNKKGITYFDWNITNGDALSQPISDKKMVASVIDNVDRFNSAIVLMHDAADKQSTVRTLPTIIEKLLAMDCELLPITVDTVPIQQITIE